MPSTTPLDVCGRRPSPATLPDFREGPSATNKGLRYPADPPSVEELIAVMRAARNDAAARADRRAVRAGLRISEALALAEKRPGPRPRRDLRSPRRIPNSEFAVLCRGRVMPSTPCW